MGINDFLPSHVLTSRNGLIFVAGQHAVQRVQDGCAHSFSGDSVHAPTPPVIALQGLVVALGLAMECNVVASPNYRQAFE